MTRKHVTIIDLVTRGPTRGLFARMMNANLASIMPQVIGVWCQELGHQVSYVCYTGHEPLADLISQETDVVFIGSFTRSALTAYAISNLYRRRGVITVLGGPHARCYPEDASQYFDYVLGFTNKTTIDDLLRELAPRPHAGQMLTTGRQPADLPAVAARWNFIETMLDKAPLIKIVPMIGSMGCPYTCSFCIDATVDYKPLPFDQIRQDLKFLLTKVQRPVVGWHDPNFGIRFNDYMTAIEDAAPKGRIKFIAESSLSILSEDRLKRLRDNGFVGMMPGIESWFDLGNKSKTGNNIGNEKVRQVADHVNTILRYIPFVQTNFVLGLDSDFDSEPFECTKRFLDRAPGAYPAFSMLTAYGRAAPLNLELQRAGRVLPIPFPFLDGNHAMNVRPLNYEWTEIYAHAADLTQYAMKGARMAKRWAANRGSTRWVNLVRSHSSRRAKFQRTMLTALRSDDSMRRFFAGSSRSLPKFYVDRINRSLGPLAEALLETAFLHDENAYLRGSSAAIGPQAPQPAPGLASRASA
ncbi:MAG: radical SAM protein [Parvibaculaceae bacterium]